MTNIVKMRIKPLNPLISRDSRPFGRGQGRRMRSLSWMTPSAVCGALRSSVGEAHGGKFDPDEIAKLNAVKVRGPFLEWRGSLYFPRPLDFVTNQRMERNTEDAEDTEDSVSTKVRGYAVRPRALEAKDGKTEMPLGLLPALIQEAPEEDFKPEPLPAFWSAAAMQRWLSLSQGENFSLKPSECLVGPVGDERTHVSIDPFFGAAADSLLFSTTGLDFMVKKEIIQRESDGREKSRRKEISQSSIAIEAESDDCLCRLSPLHVLGGERRLAEWQVMADEVKGWTPPTMSEKSVEIERLRMILTTPAIFAKGWLPGWIDETTREGTVPSSPSLKVRLVSAVTGRWMAVSGWSYEAGRRGPKPLRRMVPAGSVYFFEVDRQEFDWKDLWLRSVCDAEQDRNDGFGIALWGTW
jgi:CRISPR-associated protein Cmr3